MGIMTVQGGALTDGRDSACQFAALMIETAREDGIDSITFDLANAKVRFAQAGPPIQTYEVVAPPAFALIEIGRDIASAADFTRARRSHERGARLVGELDDPMIELPPRTPDSEPGDVVIHLPMAGRGTSSIRTACGRSTITTAPDA